MIRIIARFMQKRRIKKICKAWGYNCSECIHHDYVFEGTVFRGVRCRLKGKEV